MQKVQKGFPKGYDVSGLNWMKQKDDGSNQRRMYSDYEEEDEYCPHCDNHYVLDAITPEPKVEIEHEDLRKDSR